MKLEEDQFGRNAKGVGPRGREGEADEGSSSWTDGLGPLIFQTLLSLQSKRILER